MKSCNILQTILVLDKYNFLLTKKFPYLGSGNPFRIVQTWSVIMLVIQKSRTCCALV